MKQRASSWCLFVTSVHQHGIPELLFPIRSSQCSTVPIDSWVAFSLKPSSEKNKKDAEALSRLATRSSRLFATWATSICANLLKNGRLVGQDDDGGNALIWPA